HARPGGQLRFEPGGCHSERPESGCSGLVADEQQQNQTGRWGGWEDLPLSVPPFLPSSLLICTLSISVQREHVQGVPNGDQHLLVAVDRVGLRCIRGAANTRVPQRLAGLRVARDEGAAPVATKRKAPGGGEEAPRTAPAVHARIR